MKKCTKCKEVKSLNDFSNNSSKKDGKQSHCKKCRSKYQKQWYKINAETHKDRVSSRRKQVRLDNRAYVYGALSNTCCTDCSEDNPVVLEFDHVRGTKRAGISEIMRSRMR